MNVLTLHQLMARLEKSNLVAGRYEDRTIGDVVVVKERLYVLTDGGRDAWNETLGFYLRYTQPKG